MALLAVGLPIGCFMWGIDPDSRNFVAASDFNFARISISDVKCVSIDPVVYDGKILSDSKLPDAAVEILGIETAAMEVDFEVCPWGLHLTVLSGLDPYIDYDGLFSRYQISVGLCARRADGTMTDSCISKDIHVFTPRVDAHDLLRIALTGLRKTQDRKMELFLIKR